MVDGPFFVTYEIARRPLRRPTPDHENWKFEDLKNGFWVTKEHVLCTERQGHYWIPPSQILLIEKRDTPPSPL